MSNFLKQGKREQVRKDKKAVKGHTKEFYKILQEIDRVAEVLLEDRDNVNIDNLKEKAQEVTELEIGNLELFVLKGKLGFYEEMEKQIETDGASRQS